MKTQLLVTLVGEDKPGIVARVTAIFVDNGANLEESRMAILGGEFAAIMLVSVEEGKAEQLDKALQKLSSEGLTLTTKKTRKGEAAKGLEQYTLTLRGADHEGIVHSVATYLREKEINIEALETAVENAPVAGTPLFSMLEELRRKLDEIAKNESVDINLDAKKATARA
jgi:glycine cleavage system transcriptional repressor